MDMYLKNYSEVNSYIIGLIKPRENVAMFILSLNSIPDFLISDACQRLQIVGSVVNIIRADMRKSIATILSCLLLLSQVFLAPPLL